MPTHEYTPEELIYLAAHASREANELAQKQEADPTTVSQILVAHASAQTCALLAIARLLHEQVHNHPHDPTNTPGAEDAVRVKTSYEQALADIKAAGPQFYDPSQRPPKNC